jgi:hypothetical protein
MTYALSNASEAHWILMIGYWNLFVSYLLVIGDFAF